MKRSRPALYGFLIVAGLLASLGAFGCGRELASNMRTERDAQALEGYENLVVLYGDPHVHTSLSDGDESPDFALRYARDVVDLDWCCITDHAEVMADDGFVALDYYRTIPGKYDTPGEFCVLFAYEWTSNHYGHRNVYSLDNTIPVLPCSDPSADTPEELWEQLEGFDVLTIPHHPMIWSMEIWWKYDNFPVQNSVEFYSKWGLSLYDGNERPLSYPRHSNAVLIPLVTNGERYGLMAATDTHMSRPGSHLGESRGEGVLEYSRPGLTGVWATSHTREAIYEALKNKHTYGMTGTRVMLEFAVNSHIMGSEITSADPPQLAFRTSCDVPISAVTLLKIHNGTQEELEVHHVDALEFERSYTDEAFVEDSAYLMRVDLENTDMALCSPVWVDKTHSGDVI